MLTKLYFIITCDLVGRIWQNHIRPIERKFIVDMRTNWPLGSVALSRACFCRTKTTSSAFPSPSKQSGFEKNEA